MEKSNPILYVIVAGVVIVIAGMYLGSKRQVAPVPVTQVTQTVPVKPVDVTEIGADPAAIPAPITRSENERVVVELTTKEVVAEVLPGVTYQYWTYNGTVPGPMIRAKEGDEVEIKLIHGLHSHATADIEVEYLGATDSLIPTAYAQGNSSTTMPMGDGHDMSTMAAQHATEGHAYHSIDLHAVLGPGGGAGLSQVGHDAPKIFRFTAMRPGIYVYHCASPHVPTHIANGMYGMILVEPKEGLPKVDREFYIMQGELYTSGKYGELGHQAFSKDKLLAEAPEYFVFNGRPGSLTGNRALHAKVGETVRIYMGVGTFIPSNFHIIGEIFENLYPEGALASPPLHNVQTTIVPPGGAAVVEFTPQVAGKYLLVDHSLTRSMDKGALGELIVEGDSVPGVLTPVQ